MVNWTCPYCHHSQILGSNARLNDTVFRVGDSEIGPFGTQTIAIACLNQACKKVALTVALYEAIIAESSYNDRLTDAQLNFWNLLPESSAKALPEYIPLALKNDYLESCRIRNLSPKASATLARRCLQGMIRDFCAINEKTLFLQINKLGELVNEDKAPRGVSADSIDAIHAVRKIGNIGAHMESDINLIVEIDPNEAQILIELIESLFEEWYVGRHNREERFKKIMELDREKAAERKQS